MKCVICKNGTMKKGKITVTLDIKNTIVVIKNVPANVCANCGNYYLSATMTKKIMEKVQNAVQKGVEIEILKMTA